MGIVDRSFGLSKGGKDKPHEDLPKPTAFVAAMRAFEQDHNDFSFALYDRLRQPSANLVFSPLSIRAALAMTYAGAREKTALQMRTALRFAAGDEDLHAHFAAITDRLNKKGGGQQELAVANSLWFHDGMPLRNEFLDLVAGHYRAGMNFVDFYSDAEAVRAIINDWVAEKTKKKIRELIPPQGLAALTGLVLVNAIYFKGQWLLPFRESATCDEPFYLDGGEKVQAPLMHQTEIVRYADKGDFQAIELDYRDSDLSMLLLLPEKKVGLEQLEKNLSASSLRQCLAEMTEREVEIFLPRFKMTWGTFEIGDRLSALGMPNAFDRNLADFSGINGCTPPQYYALFISRVFHQALVEVNEAGTEAAAATAVGAVCFGLIQDGAPPVPVFKADNPFLFAIRDRVSGAILFLGRVADPTQEG